MHLSHSKIYNTRIHAFNTYMCMCIVSKLFVADCKMNKAEELLNKIYNISLTCQLCIHIIHAYVYMEGCLSYIMLGKGCMMYMFYTSKQMKLYQPG